MDVGECTNGEVVSARRRVASVPSALWIDAHAEVILVDARWRPSCGLMLMSTPGPVS
jgi:hypothetical protein